jgi:hypothetical protein
MQQNGASHLGNHPYISLSDTVLPMPSHSAEREILLVLLTRHFELAGRVYAIVCPDLSDGDLKTSSVGLEFPFGRNQLTCVFTVMKGRVDKTGIMIYPQIAVLVAF